MQRSVPAPPRVISPTPTPTDTEKEDYFADGTLGITPRRSSRLQSKTLDPSASDSPAPDARARPKTRDEPSLRARRQHETTAADKTPKKTQQTNGTAPPNGQLLSPPGAGFFSSSWRSLSRSPSPLGLIPIHKSWRTFVHRHEIPRKALHVSIGFVTLYLYTRGFEAAQIHPALLGALIPIAGVDVLRHHWRAFNDVYVRLMGAFMRESEVHDRYNGVIWYLLGAWAVMRFCPKDIAVLAVVLLSWCDTAASTVGRAFGRYTPQVRRGKSLAGSLAAAAVGVASALLFWGVVGPAFEAPAGPQVNTGAQAFAFQGWLALPAPLAGFLGVQGARVTGGVALGIASVVAGVIASASEAVDLFGLDDNVSIPVLCGAGIWGFLWIFGAG